MLIDSSWSITYSNDKYFIRKRYQTGMTLTYSGNEITIWVEYYRIYKIYYVKEKTFNNPFRSEYSS